MKAPRLLIVLVTSFAVFACMNPVDPPPDDPGVAGAPDPADTSDGWASASGAPASPGGYGAAEANVYTVHSRSELVSALNCGGSSASNTPKIIYVEGMIDLCADTSDNSLSAYDFIVRAGYGATYADYQAYMDAYAASCATGVASTLASTRTALYNAQKAVVIIKVGSNTSILGKDSDAGFKNGELLIDTKTNVVIRNVSVLDAYDYFPAWDESENLINSQYDNIGVSGSTYVWIDHCTLGDGDRPDSALPNVTISGVQKKWVTHDGLIDIVRAADLVTVSWNRIENHDKTMLYGNSDSADAQDTGKIRVTVHHNYFNGAKQRLPRVRFGQVHVYNNYYTNVGGYAVGVGDHARIYSEANYFNAVAAPFDAYDHAGHEGYYWDSGSVNATGGSKAMGTPADVGWTPSDYYTYTADSAVSVAADVPSGAGVGQF
jgi:pectate lyase